MNSAHSLVLFHQLRLEMTPPEYLGPYRIGETLGKGGMGSVFKAKHAKSGQDVAVKLIATQMSDDMRFRRRFDTEIKTLQLLSHPNIVKLVGFGEEQGMLFYSMEFVEGETLQELIRRQKKLPWMTVLDIAIQVCAALKHAHDFGVIHRDLKPANFVVQQDGTVKLLDFGISKVFGEDQTAVGSVLGTADYMAPEQASGAGITARTDLFALGCIMYAMLCGKPPFRGKNITEVISALQHKDPVPLDLVDPELPDDVVQIVSELLEKLPENRPPTALAVMNRLKAMRAGLHRMQTLADRVDDKSKSLPGESSSTRQFDTTGPEKPRDGKKTSIESAKTRPDDTVPFRDEEDSVHTSMTKVDPLAHTVHTEGQDSHRGTVQGTGITVPPENKRAAKGSASESQANLNSDFDTSAGSSGSTHFQTVSDGDVREGFFVTPKAKTEHPAWRAASIASLSLILLVGAVFLIVSTRGPTADELLVNIDSPGGEVQSFEIQDEMQRFLKLFPDHPRFDEIRQRETIYRVEATVRRLKFKAKVRISEAPLYEQAFVDAMELRRDDPPAAREKLLQWIAVFNDSSLGAESAKSQLAELAAFEAGRLAEARDENDGQPGDPKLAELMNRIDNTQQMPDEQRKIFLQGVVTLYDGQPWAATARERAQAMLDAEAE